MTKWQVIQDDEFIHVVPESDTKPHGFVTNGEKSVELATTDCPCVPKVEIGNADGLYEKPVITHNCFKYMDLVKESVDKITK